MLQILFLYLFLLSLVLSSPILDSNIVAKTPNAHNPPFTRKTMRILALGDSITWGKLSETGNGYRGPLYTLLSDSDNAVNMVGSTRTGTMPDPHHEGHRGAIIKKIAFHAMKSLPARPNVVLLHAGTNDMVFNVNRTTAPERLGLLIDNVYKLCPDATVLVAQIIPSRNRKVEDRILEFNSQVPEIIQRRRDAGNKILMVNMHSALSVETDMGDDYHPIDAGYEKMAQVWYRGLMEAARLGWIHRPVRVGVGMKLKRVR